MLLSASALAFVAAPATLTPVFAQDTAATPAAPQCNIEERDKLYNDKFFPNYKKSNTPQQREVAFQAGKEYLSKYNNCATSEDEKKVVAFLTKWVADYEKDKAEKATIDAINTAAKSKDAAVLFTKGKEFYAQNPDNLTIALFIADSGYEAAKKKVDTYNNETVTLAKQIIEKVNSGKMPADNNWGPFKDKDEAMAWMNYTIGFITYDRMNKKNEAAPFIYKAIQSHNAFKNWHYPYLLIAGMYLDDYTKAAKEYETNKESTDVELVKKLIGTYKAYADRAIEAYAKAYSVAKAEKKEDVAKSIYDGELTQFYKLRHDGQTTGMTEFVAAQASKSLTDPTTPVTPVIETTPTTATTTPAASTTITASTKVADTAAPTKSASTNGVKTAANGAKTNTATTKPAKKPVPKKRGNK